MDSGDNGVRGVTVSRGAGLLEKGQKVENAIILRRRKLEGNVMGET